MPGVNEMHLSALNRLTGWHLVHSPLRHQNQDGELEDARAEVRSFQSMTLWHLHGRNWARLRGLWTIYTLWRSSERNLYICPCLSIGINEHIPIGEAYGQTLSLISSSGSCAVRKGMTLNRAWSFRDWSRGSSFVMKATRTWKHVSCIH